MVNAVHPPLAFTSRLGDNLWQAFCPLYAWELQSMGMISSEDIPWRLAHALYSRWVLNTMGKIVNTNFEACHRWSARCLIQLLRNSKFKIFYKQPPG